jgi:WD40 repeat protein
MKNFNLKKFMLVGLSLFAGVALFGQGVCTQFNYYYADINYPSSGKQTDIYEVALDGDDAIMTPIIEDLAFGAHIAYDEASGLLYVVNDQNGEIRILDPETGDITEPISVNINVSGVTTAAFNSEGKLLIGSGNNGKIYEVDLDANPYELSVFAEDNDISGGDITFSAAGNLYLASKPEGKLYDVIPGFANPVLGNVNGQVTGMATFEDGESVIVSSRNNNQFLVYSVNGGVSESAAYNAILNEEPFQLDNGDMASGCGERSTSIEGCDDFRTYYIHDALGGGPDILYSVEFNDMGGANLSQLAELGGGSHLGVGADGLLYIVRHGSGLMTVWNPSTLMVEYEVQITFNGQNVTGIPAVVVGDDGFVYVGANNDIVYKVDPVSGIAEIEGEADVNGGDLVFVGDALWLANRAQGRFYEVGGAGEFDVAAEEINGVANLPDGKLLISNGNFNGLFEVYEPLTGNATGETFETGLELYNGDLASRCFDGQAQECQNFVIYLSANAAQGGDIYRVTLNEGSADLELVLENLGDPHIAFDEALGLLYIVKGSGEVAIYDPATNFLTSFENISMGSMNINATYAAVVDDEGKLLVGSASQNKVYEVNPATGDASNPIDVPVDGGDLVQTLDGNVWLINRAQNRFYNITDGVTQFDVDELNEMYGAAVLADGLILVGDAGNQLRVVDPSIPGVIGTSYDLDINITAGDLAAGCSDNNPVEEPEPGECYAAEVIEYVQGLKNNEQPIAANRTNPQQALGEPEGTDNLVFVTLGYGGSLTLGFNGSVPNLEGDDIQVIETTFNNSVGCETYPEYADVYVSPNGTDFFLAGTVCKSDNAVDISDAGPFDYIELVKLVNNDSLTTTPDAFDVDGVIAIHNCVEEPELNPFCTNETVITEESDDIIRLTAMGWYQECNGDYGMRWRIRNGSDEAIEAYYNFAGEPAMQGPFNLEAGEAIHFTSGIYQTNNFSKTMRVFVDGQQVQVKAHGGSTADLADCLPEGCPDNDNEALEAPVVDFYLQSYPNPTEDITTIEFNAPSTQRALVEVFDMNGRSVVALFNQEVQQGETYRITFDGTALPNGIYVVKYVTETETIIEKVMIAR